MATFLAGLAFMLLSQAASAWGPLGHRAIGAVADALKWISHLVADLHQPLHAADYAQGGNLVHVDFGGGAGASAWTLHAAWDVRLLASALHAGSGQQPSEPTLRSLIARARRVPAA